VPFLAGNLSAVFINSVNLFVFFNFEDKYGIVTLDKCLLVVHICW
jgi:hypothetical protein